MLVKPSPDTTASITLEGEARPIVVPTTILSRVDAELLRDYKIFLTARELDEELFCPDCYASGHKGSPIRVGDQQLAILCRHRLLFFQGALPPPTRFTDMLAQEARLVAPAQLTLTDVIPDVSLERAEAALLRAYKPFLEKYALREALTCRTCWANSYAEGVRAFVTPTTIAIHCRHRRLNYHGATL